MRLHFLQAAVPLTKTFIQNDDGSLEKSSYPLVKKFSSVEAEVRTTEEFFLAMRLHAEQNLCLLKGLLDRPLREESRAGRTDAMTPTQWLVLDVDGLEGFNTSEQFIGQVLPYAFAEASYVLQYSASHGIGSNGLRAHLFFRLANPVVPSVLKSWLTGLNLQNNALSNQVRLSRNGMTLSFPVDRTVAQNDKLIYIAPPRCIGFEDPLAGHRIQLVSKAKDAVEFEFPAPQDAQHQQLIDKRIAELRKDAGYKLSKPKMKFVDSISEWVLTNPEHGTVTSIKEQNGFIRLNINGGDSWGYFFSPENPRYLYNFKGEPTVILKDFLPDFWDEWQTKMRATRRERVIVFRHAPTDTWWGGVYDPVNDRLDGMHTIKSRDRIEDFCHNHNVEPPDPIPDWVYEFQPYNETICDLKAQFANRWQPTELMKRARSNPNKEIPLVIRRLLWSVVGGDQEAGEHFINWLAVIYQKRIKTGTAWVLHGTQGTGKGLLFNEVLRPIFGHQHCVTRELHNLDDKFNDFMETALLVNIDEARVDNAARARKVVNQLKHVITEPIIDIRAMRQEWRQVRNFSNFIFTSNDYDAMKIDPADRRFNVAPRQEDKIDISEAELAALPSELEAFAAFLNNYEIDVERAKRPLANRAKTIMRKHSLDAIEQFCDALVKGDLAFFIALSEYGPGNSMDDIDAWNQFDAALQRWATQANTLKECVVKRKELLAAYRYAFDGRIKPQKFNRLLEHKNVPEPKQCWTGDRLEYGIPILWTCQTEMLKTLSTATSKNVVWMHHQEEARQ